MCWKDALFNQEMRVGGRNQTLIFLVQICRQDWGEGKRTSFLCSCIPRSLSCSFMAACPRPWWRPVPAPSMFTPARWTRTSPRRPRPSSRCLCSVRVRILVGFPYGWMAFILIVLPLTINSFYFWIEHKAFWGRPPCVFSQYHLYVLKGDNSLPFFLSPTPRSFLMPHPPTHESRNKEFFVVIGTHTVMNFEQIGGNRNGQRPCGL